MADLFRISGTGRTWTVPHKRRGLTDKRKDIMSPIKKWRYRALAALGASALLVGAGGFAAGSASAATFTDTSLQAQGFAGLLQHQTCSPPVAVPSAGGGTKTLTYTAAANTTFSSDSLTRGTGGTATEALNVAGTLLTVTGTSGITSTDDVLKFNIVTSAGCVGVETDSISEAAGLLTPVTPALDVVNFSPTSLSFATDDNTTGGIAFHAVSSAATPPNVNSFLVSNLPSGLNGSIGTGELGIGTAIPGTYNNVMVQVTDSAGAIALANFHLKVNGQVAHVIGNVGDEVNAFDNGFDVLSQHFVAGAVVVGWDATKGDPATHFLRIAHGSNWQFEAINAKGIATALCVSDPGGGWADPIGPNGLLITPCNNGNFQEWSLVSAEPSQLRNVATGLLVSPSGTGVQLQGTVNPAVLCASCDSHYTWKTVYQLP